MSPGAPLVYDFDGVARWISKQNIDIFRLDLIVLPINLYGYHCVLAMVDLRARKFVYCNPAGHGDVRNVIQAF